MDLTQLLSSATRAGDLLASFASAFDQRTRLLKVAFDAQSGLAEGTLLPHRLVGREAVNEGFRYELEALSSDVNLELKRLLGVPVEVTILTDAGTERELCGLVTEARKEGSDGGFAVYRLVIESALAALSHRVTARVFTATDVRALSSRIIGEHLQANGVLASSFALVDRCTREYPSHPFWMQYNESDFDYLRRIWAREGISFVVLPAESSSSDHPQHAVVLFDDPMTLDVNPSASARFHRADGTEDTDAVTAWEAHRTLQSGSVSRSSWEQGTASQHDLTEAVGSDQGGHGTALASTLDDYVHEPHLEVREGQAFDEAILLRRQRKEQRTKAFSGQGSVRTFQAGTWFELKQHPVHDQDEVLDRQFVLLSVEVEAVNNLPKDLKGGLSGLLGKVLKDEPSAARPEPPYTNRFTCLRRGIPILPREILPPIPGLMTARVVGTGGDVHTDELGRIKVRFLFTREAEHTDSGASETDADSAWVRQAEVWSSQGFGANFVPRVGDEVVVQFLGDDPDKPIVTGCVYNGVKPPASFSKASALPLDKTMSGFRSQMHGGSTGNELVLDDTTNELRARFATDHEATALNLGHLVHPRSGGVADPKGEGFELRTNAWGAVRAEKGLLLSTDIRGAARSHHADPKELTDQTKTSLELTKNLSDYSQNHEAQKLAAFDTTKALQKTADARKPHAYKDTEEHVASFDTSILALSSPAGIVEGTPGTIVKSTGKHFHVTTGQDTTLAVGRKLVMAIQDTWTAVAKGIKLFAGKGDIAIQAHEGSINLNAEKDLHLVACNQGIDMAAPDTITLAAGGAKVILSGPSMTFITPKKVNCKAKWNVVLPKPKTPELPSLVKEGEVLDNGFVIRDSKGSPVPNVRYQLTSETGQVVKGYTDSNGLTGRISTCDPKQVKLEVFRD